MLYQMLLTPHWTPHWGLIKHTSCPVHLLPSASSSCVVLVTGCTDVGLHPTENERADYTKTRSAEMISQINMQKPALRFEFERVTIKALVGWKKKCGKTKIPPSLARDLVKEVMTPLTKRKIIFVSQKFSVLTPDSQNMPCTMYLGR